jgi:hypothetical protein
MILCEGDAPEGDPGQSCVHLFARVQLSFNFFCLLLLYSIYLNGCNTDRFRYGTPVLVYFVSSAVHYVFVNTDIQTLDFAPPPSLSPALPSESSTGHTQEERKKTW